MSFKTHVSNVCRRAGRQLNALRRLSKNLTMKVRLAAFNSFLKSQFTYCSLIWGNNNKTQAARLEKLQERAIRLVFDDYRSDYLGLLARANIDTIAARNDKILCKLVFNAVNCFTPPYISDLFILKNHDISLRGFKRLEVPRPKSTGYGLKSLCYRGARLWNALDDPIKMANRDSFSKKLNSVDFSEVQYRF